MSPVLVLRPQPGADVTAQRLREAGLEPIIYPLFEVEPISWQVPELREFHALMITSANAARWAREALQHFAGLPTFAVGAATASALRERGFTDIHAGIADAGALVGEIQSAGYKNILHLCGEHVRHVDRGSLNIRRIAVYRTKDAGDAEGLYAVLERDPVIMVHSPRAGARLAELLPLSRRDGRNVITISRAAADACGRGWARLTASDTPSDAAMLAILRRICEI